MGINNIVKGHVNELLNNNDKLSEMRMKICRKCPLYKEKWYGPICNHKLWLNVETGETSEEPKEGYINGCMCRLEAKTRDIDSECTIKKW